MQVKYATMKSIHKSFTLVMLAIIVLISAFGCQSKKKAMQATNAANERTRLEREAALKKQHEQEEEALKREAEERARREAEIKPVEKEIKERPSEAARLSHYFEAIAGSGNVGSANNSINEALALFASPETPVLIVISEENGQKDYDKPTTIKNYLNYLKDQKKNTSTVSDLKVNASGKITEVELKKNF
jgi:hypothetical protein